jgi:hypothetical protein
LQTASKTSATGFAILPCTWNNAIPIQEIHDRWVGAYAAGAGKLLTRLRKALEE